MNIEQEKKEGSTPSPTTLTLFRFSDQKLYEIANYYIKRVNLSHESFVAESAFVNLRQETEVKKGRLNQNMRELTDRSIARIDSATASTAYLKLFDELSQRGVSAQEIYDFYMWCLAFNTRLCQLSRQEIGGNYDQFGSIDFLTKQNPSGSKLNVETAKMLDKEKEVAPSWFIGSNEEWKSFFRDHAYFGIYLQDFFVEYPQFQRPLIQVPLGRTTNDELPDWLDDTERTPPARSAVEAELVTDLEEEVQSTKATEVLDRQYHYLQKVMDEKSVKAILYLQKRRRELFSEIKGFTEAIVLLGSSHHWPDFTIDPLDVPNVTRSQILDSVITEDKAHDARIKNLAQSNDILMSRESIALWIEKKLLEGKLFGNAQDIIDDNILSVVNSLFDELLQEEPNPDFQALRNKNKRVFRALNYDINPLLEVLDKNEIEYLQELTGVSQGDPLESLIWEVAELVSSKLKRGNREEVPKQTGITLNHMQQFFTSWLRDNYYWVVTQLASYLRMKLAESRDKEKSDNLLATVDQQAPVSTEVQEEIQEIEDVVEEYQKGNLGGWHLYYTTDRSLNPESFVEIGGEVATLKEREEAFEQFVGKEKIPCTVQPASIVRSLDTLLAVPQATEWIRPRMEVKGEVFKKDRHPMGMRTLYVMDPSKKEIVFFIYKKKAWEYRF